MNSANGFTCVICRDSICCDSTKFQSIELTCRHAFGKNCMRKWLESSHQNKCLLCQSPLTDEEVKKIKKIPLQERAVIILEKAFKLFGRTIMQFVAPSFFMARCMFALGVAAGAVGDVEGSWGAFGVDAAIAVLAAGAAIGAVGAAAGVNRGVALGISAAAGAAAGPAILAAGGVTFRANIIGSIYAGLLGAFTAFGANYPYESQKMNPVVV